MLHAKIEMPELNHHDWQVVQIAMRDAASIRCSLSKETHPMLSRLFKALRFLTGNDSCRTLTDERLETLRRFLTASRRTQKVEERYIADLLEFGFNRRQIEALALLER